MNLINKIQMIFTSCYLCQAPSKDIICDNCYNKIIKYKIYSEIDKIKVYEIDIKYYSLFRYENIIRDIMLLYKSGVKDYKKFFKKELKKWLISKNISIDEMLFLPLPASFKGLKERGYDQCIEILKNGKFNYYQLFIINKNNNKIQKKLNQKDRENNVKKKFNIIKNKKLENLIKECKYICIFDDINTTGSSLTAALNLFLNLYKKEVRDKTIFCLTLCKEDDNL